MAEFPVLDRREFTLQSAMAVLGGVTITITGCGGGGSPSSSNNSNPAAPGTPAADMAAAITSNHGHSGVITAAQLVAGQALQLNIRGEADHPHMVELTSAEIARIRSNQSVSKSSSMDSSTMGAHQHTVTFAREGEPTGPGY